jgi:acetoin utilization deacetylase AcuC-like enzyme
MAAIDVYYHPVCLEHETGEHPENKRRLAVTVQTLLDSGLDLHWITPEPAPVEAIAQVHDLAYIRSVEEMAEKGGGWLDGDTVVSPKSYEAALVAAGAGLMAVDKALQTGEKAFLLVRPPGHHACPNRGMGFCLFNNIAVAAAYALAEKGLERVLIVDWDVHHGNGTQAMFYAEPQVLFFSMHEAGHYPGTGKTVETGADIAAGTTVNVPLMAGDGDGAVRQAFDTILEPLARYFKPQLILVSAGYDPQAGDPLGDLTFSRTAFQWMAARLVQMAEEVGAVGPICFLEGGYSPEMLSQSVAATIRGLGGELPEFAPAVTADERADVREALEEIKPYWKPAF